jgi:hypothetical protein
VLKYFYDPHPGLMGAIIPLPSVLKDAVDKLDDKTLDLNTVLKSLKELGSSIGAEVENRKDMIVATMRKDGYIHSWRLIFYRDVR